MGLILCHECGAKIFDKALSYTRCIFVIKDTMLPKSVQDKYGTYTYVNNEYSYDIRNFFSPDRLEKYVTIAKGEEWKDGDVIDEYC